MANSFIFNEKTFATGDTIVIDYLIDEGNKKRIQKYSGIVIKIRGKDESNRMITVRYRSKAGIGMERIFPVSSPYIKDIQLRKKGTYTKAKAYFIRDLSDKNMRRKIYKTKRES